MVFVGRKKHSQCQIIYVTNQDRKDVVYVTAIFILRKLIVHAVQQDFGQSHEIREYGNNDVLLCNVKLEGILSDT